MGNSSFSCPCVNSFANKEKIKIKKAKNVKIGNRYYWSNVNDVIRKANVKKEPCEEESCNSDDHSGLIALSEELISSERILDIDDFYLVAERISDKWRKLARFLPPKTVFQEGELKTLESNNKNNMEETIIQMLNLWKEKYPDLTTVGNLAVTLQSIGRADIAQLLRP
ncbi:uncharacterized protein LOC111634398 [Centruroides sculpturatus]|uniref:uncharacterized protein LOC111634398 n=1 Tax=Centruroides sculpturatus TaxID=218467 RepID=UPI000C6E0D61|nr:uncharacterized protein LOC111634398 [Centruroides sculpturatus]